MKRGRLSLNTPGRRPVWRFRLITPFSTWFTCCKPQGSAQRVSAATPSARTIATATGTRKSWRGEYPAEESPSSSRSAARRPTPSWIPSMYARGSARTRKCGANARVTLPRSESRIEALNTTSLSCSSCTSTRSWRMASNLAGAGGVDGLRSALAEERQVRPVLRHARAGAGGVGGRRRALGRARLGGVRRMGPEHRARRVPALRAMAFRAAWLVPHAGRPGTRVVQRLRAAALRRGRVLVPPPALRAWSGGRAGAGARRRAADAERARGARRNRHRRRPPRGNLSLLCARRAARRPRAGRSRGRGARARLDAVGRRRCGGRTRARRARLAGMALAPAARRRESPRRGRTPALTGGWLGAGP